MVDYPIEDINSLTVNILSDRLRDRGHLDSGEVIDVENKSGNPASNPTYHLILTYSRDASESAPRRLFLKLLQGGGDAIREGMFYRDYLPLIPHPPVPYCYDVCLDESSKNGHLLLEDLTQTHALPLLPDSDPKEEVAGYKRRLTSNDELKDLLQGVIDALLRLQAPLWENVLFEEPLIGNPFLGETTSTALMEKSCRDLRDKILPVFADRFRDRLQQYQQDILNQLLENWTPLYSARVANGKALTFAPTDFHIHNVLYPYDAQDHSLVIFDFGDYTKGIGSIPIVHFLVTSSITTYQKKGTDVQMLRQYHDGLMASGIQGYSWDDCIHDFRLGILANMGRELLVGRFEFLVETMALFEAWECYDLLS